MVHNGMMGTFLQIKSQWKVTLSKYATSVLLMLLTKCSCSSLWVHWVVLAKTVNKVCILPTFIGWSCSGQLKVMFLKMSKRIHCSTLRIDVKMQEFFENMVNLYHLPLRLNRDFCPQNTRFYPFS